RGSRLAWLAVLLASGALGCGGTSDPPAEPGGSEKKGQPAAVQPAPGGAPKVANREKLKPAEMLLGKWEDRANKRGVELAPKGVVKLARFRNLPLEGTYRLLEGDRIEIHFQGRKEKERLKFRVTPNQLTFTGPGKDASPV